MRFGRGANGAVSDWCTLTDHTNLRSLPYPARDNG